MAVKFLNICHSRRIVKLQCDLAESENKETGQLRLQILLRFEVNYFWLELNYLSPRLSHSSES